jgi:hypothetical protein
MPNSNDINSTKAGETTPASTSNNTIKVSGTVYDAQTENRIVGAVILATSTTDGYKPQTSITDDDGDFSLDLEKGSWILQALAKDYQTQPKLEETLDRNTNDNNFRLERLSGSLDRNLGVRLFVVLSIILLGLVLGYVFAHAASPNYVLRDKALTGLIEKAQNDAGKIAQVTTTTTIAESMSNTGNIAVAATSGITTTVNAISNTLTTLFIDDPLIVSDAKMQEIKDRITEIRAGILSSKGDSVKSGLDALYIIVESASTGYFWTRNPWRYVEVLLWALAGVLASIVVGVGFDLYKGSFLREGLFTHIARILTIPIAALVTIFLLSLITLVISVGENQIKLDLSDTKLLVAITFIISVVPSLLWNWLLGIPEKFFKGNQLSNISKSDTTKA